MCVHKERVLTRRRFMRMMSSVGASVGYDDGSLVSNRYQDAFPFEGTIERVDIQLVSHNAETETAINEAVSRSIQARQ